MSPVCQRIPGREEANKSCPERGTSCVRGKGGETPGPRHRKKHHTHTSTTSPHPLVCADNLLRDHTARVLRLGRTLSVFSNFICCMDGKYLYVAQFGGKIHTSFNPNYLPDVQKLYRLHLYEVLTHAEWAYEKFPSSQFLNLTSEMLNQIILGLSDQDK